MLPASSFLFSSHTTMASLPPRQTTSDRRRYSQHNDSSSTYDSRESSERCEPCPFACVKRSESSKLDWVARRSTRLADIKGLQKAWNCVLRQGQCADNTGCVKNKSNHLGSTMSQIVSAQLPSFDVVMAVYVAGIMSHKMTVVLIKLLSNTHLIHTSRYLALG